MRKALVLVACSLAVAACGSTVQVQSVSGGAGAGLDAGSLGTTTGGPGPTAPGPATGGLAGPGAPGAPVTGGAAPGGTAGPIGGRPGQAVATVAPARGSKPADVPGVTSTTVKIGVEYISTAELGAFANSAGVDAVGETDMLKAYQAVAGAVNAAGGVAGGRRIVIVPRERSASESTSQASQTSCAAFTDDDRVLLANLFHNMDSPGVPCLTSRGVVAIGGANVEAGSQKDFDRFGGRYLSPGTVETVTAARTYVDALVRQGFLGKTSKIGLLWFGFSDFREARAKGLVPALARYGLTLESEYEASYSGNPAELGQIAAQMQGAVLRFRNDGVDRVLTLDYQGTLQYFFMNNAESQEYRPKYGLATWSDAEFLRANGSAAQLAGSTGIGWMPGYDLAISQQPTDEPRKRCLAVMKAAQMPVLKAQTDALIQYRACEEVFFAERLLNTATDLSPKGLAAAAAALRTQPSYSGFGQAFSATKRWGGSTYRDLAFDSSCTCFSYRGPDRPF